MSDEEAKPVDLKVQAATAAAEESMKRLETLAGVVPERTIQIGDRTIVVQIKQIKTGKIPKLVKAAGNLMQLLTNKQVSLDVPQLIMYFPEECLNVLALLCDQPREVIDEFELDDTVTLITDALAVNVDFFVRRILPSMRGRLVEMVAAQKTSDGQEPPSTSSSTAT